MQIKIFDNKLEVARAFSSYLAHLVDSKESIHIALSGGSTPKIVFDVLASEYRDLINWSKVHLYWGDERCVLPTDEQSNFKMTTEHLISKVDIPFNNVNRIKGESDPREEAARYGQLLESKLPLKECNRPAFDLVILGMGEDGHTASIFPHQMELWTSEDCCVVASHPHSGQKRISISGDMINASNEVVFLVTGASKRNKVAEILNKEGDYQANPAALVAPKYGELSWFLDEAAAEGIQGRPRFK